MMSRSDATSRKITLAQANFNPKQNRISNSRTAARDNENDTLGPLQSMQNNSTKNIFNKRNSNASYADTSTALNYYSQSIGQRFENTYHLGPNDKQKFNIHLVESVVGDVLENQLKNTNYDSNRCKELTTLLSDDIKQRLKSAIYKRYKYVVVLSIGQKGDNSILMASRCLWNAETDNACSVKYENKSLYAIATIFAVYYD
jgi:tctex1 domain-containing protein 2